VERCPTVDLSISLDTSEPTSLGIKTPTELSIEEQIRLLELGIEAQILTPVEIARLKSLGLNQTDQKVGHRKNDRLKG